MHTTDFRLLTGIVTLAAPIAAGKARGMAAHTRNDGFADSLRPGATPAPRRAVSLRRPVPKAR